MNNKVSTKHVVYLLLSLSTTIGVGWYFLSRHRVGDVLDAIHGVSLQWIAAFVALSLLMSGFRTWRYFLLLGLNNYRVPLVPLFLVTLARNLFSDLLPARIGTVIYIYLVNTRLGIPAGAATSSFAFSLLFDLVAVCPLIILAIFLVTAPAGIDTNMLLLAAFALCVLFIAAIWLLPRVLEFVCWRLKGRAHSDKLSKFLLDVADAVAQVSSAGLYCQIFSLSVVIRLLKYLSLYVFLVGLGASMGIASEVLQFGTSLFGLLAAEFAASLPISGIAGFGVYEGAWAFTFSLLGLEQRLAEMSAIAHHLFTQAYGYGLGAMALLLLLMPIFPRAKHETEIVPCASGTLFMLRFFLGVSLGAIALLAPFALAEQKVTTETSQWSPAEPLPEILFDSNRGGTFGVYGINADGSGLRQIVDGAQHEMFPDISPSGALLSYSRHVGLRRGGVADVVVRTLASGEERVIENGVFPSFSADGEKVYFERSRKKVIAYYLETGRETEIFPGDAFPEMQGYEVVKPRFSRSGRYLVFTSDKGGRWNAWLADLIDKKLFNIGNGCEPVMHPGEQKLLFVDTKSMRAGSGFREFDISSGKKVTLLDSNDPWGHEYFPSFSPSGSKILFSAAPPGEHSHETARYQLFIFDTESKQLRQITDDGFTNRWPKLVRIG